MEVRALAEEAQWVARRANASPLPDSIVQWRRCAQLQRDLTACACVALKNVEAILRDTSRRTRSVGAHAPRLAAPGISREIERRDRVA